MAKVELKQPIVQEISDNMKDAQSVVVVDYRGLTVAEDTQLRKTLREAGIIYKVYKNTLVSRAIEGTEFESLKDSLEGPSAFAISKEDATAPARILAKFAKTAPALEMKAGVVEGNLYDAKGMAVIAEVPAREELLSRLLGSLQSPIANLARVLNQIAEKGGAAAASVAPDAAVAPVEAEAPAEEAAEAPAETEAPAEEAAETEVSATEE
ncbi:MAG: 50S ribosomal protein L10 [Roseburia sp.]